MIDARNEDELKSGTDLSGWLSWRILDKFPRSPLYERRICNACHS